MSKSVMHDWLARLYRNGEINEVMLDTALKKGWIDINEKNSIVNFEELEG